jgi:Mn2+/Fe2+ NRAMP family transporter
MMASMAIAVLLNLIGINPMRSLVVAALLNGLTAPILMFIIWWLARDKQLLGELASPWWSNLLVSIGAIAMAALPVLWLFAPA